MKIGYTNNLIPQNVLPSNATKVAIFNGNISIYELDMPMPDKGNKLYSFGAIADVHLQYDTAHTDFQRALTFLNETENVDFICIAGDLTSGGTDAQLVEYKNYVDTYSANTPVYAITGNHEAYRGTDLPSIIEKYTGHPLYYSFECGNDVFIMVGVKGDSSGNLFTTAELQWLYETLEANRNKRCFIFEHVRPQDACGNAYGIYSLDIWGGTEQTVFESLLRHYKNVIMFHGHSHLKYDLQTKTNKANIDKDTFGTWQVHVSSLAVPRTGDPSGAASRVEVYADSEGYVVDVYENGILLRGRDFVAEKFLPLATYWLDTKLQYVEGGMYTDSTGTINTNQQ